MDLKVNKRPPEKLPPRLALYGMLVLLAFSSAGMYLQLTPLANSVLFPSNTMLRSSRVIRGHVLHDMMQQSDRMGNEVQPKFVHLLLGNLTLDGLVQTNINLWLSMNPDYTVVIHRNDDVALFLNTTMREFKGLFETVGSYVERGDIMRYLLVYFFGGVYADSDVEPLRPIAEWMYPFVDGTNNKAPPIEAMIGTENLPQYFQQYCLVAFRRFHPLYREVIQHVRDNIFLEFSQGHLQKGWDAIRRTGPRPFSAAARKLLNISESISKMPTYVDSKYRVAVDGERRFRGIHRDISFVYHHSVGSWKKSSRFGDARRYFTDTALPRWQQGDLQF